MRLSLISNDFSSLCLCILIIAVQSYINQYNQYIIGDMKKKKKKRASGIQD